MGTKKKAPPPPPRRGRRLATVANVKSALGDVLRKLELGSITESKARVSIYGLSVLAGVIYQGEVEARVDELERAASEVDHD